jgi:hypothetical protein
MSFQSVTSALKADRCNGRGSRAGSVLHRLEIACEASMSRLKTMLPVAGTVSASALAGPGRCSNARGRALLVPTASVRYLVENGALA